MPSRATLGRPEPRKIRTELFVEFNNRSGKRLRGVIHRSPLPARYGTPGVIFFHGFTGDRMESHWIFVKCARALARAGIASLRFDFFGSGESDGEFRQVTLQGEISDALAAIHYFRWQRGIDRNRLGLIGLSLGGAIAATVAVEVEAKALVLWAALAHPQQLRALAEKTTTLIPGGKGLRDYSGHAVSPAFLENIEKVDPLKSIARFKHPTLIIHPEKDEYLPLSHPRDFFNAAGSDIKEEVIIPGADHTFTSVEWEREVIGRTVKWLRKYLP
ncbi:MAG TPA: alpha/beta fold hydrolase [Terriglobia bacterium]|nr:alpha/beta fold hydrolase [Terriglobia bacterium]